MSVVEPRENLIDTAVKFLQNPKVQQSPFQQRKAFLERKGLTEEEIQLAVERSGTGGDVTAVEPISNHQITHAVTPAQPEATAWSKARDYLATAIVVGGVSYAVYVFYKKYLEPYWFGPSKQERQMDDLTRGVSELQRNISETLQQIQETQTILSKQQEVIQDMARNYASVRGPVELERMQGDQTMNEIKEEIKSLKALMLSSRRFPAAPATTPVLPSWQLTPTKSQVSTPSGGAETSVTDANKGNRTSETEGEEKNSSERLSPDASESGVKTDQSDEIKTSQKILAEESSADVEGETEQREFIEDSNTNNDDLETNNANQVPVDATA